MQKKYLFKSSYLCGAALLVLLITGIYSCTKKSDGVDNNTIVETPYSLFFSDSAGGVYTSNDGKAYTTIFQQDGFPCRALCSQYTNILIIKDNLYTSTDNGKDFSLGNNTIPSITATDCNNNTIGLNESMILNIPSWGRVYVPTNNPASTNYLGQCFSFSGGSYGSWTNFDGYDTTTGHVGDLPTHMISYTRLNCGTVCGLALDQASTVNNFVYRNFYKNDTPLRTDPWEEVTGLSSTPQAYAPWNETGTPLPNNSFFTLGHYNNRLIAIDSKCANGAYYSDDTGRTWIQYPGFPANLSLLSICSPFEESCLIGTANGLYALNNNTGIFQLNSSGLTDGIRVNGITYKQNILKSGTKQKLVYLATNKGIYQSTDGGNNFILTIPGNYTTIY